MCIRERLARIEEAKARGEVMETAKNDSNDRENKEEDDISVTSDASERRRVH
jgi:hypothetical protein